MILLDQKHIVTSPLGVAFCVTFGAQRGFLEKNFLSGIYITEPEYL